MLGLSANLWNCGLFLSSGSCNTEMTIGEQASFSFICMYTQEGTCQVM